MFLVAGYGKYSCPYVWVRSNHDRLVKLSDNPSFSKDSPLRLKSTAARGDKGKTGMWEPVMMGIQGGGSMIGWGRGEEEQWMRKGG